MKSDLTTLSYREQLSDENALLLRILDGTSNETGESFFRVLVKDLALVLNTYGALVADYDCEKSQLRPRAYWLGDQWVDPSPYDIAGTPCEGVIRRGELFQLPDHVIDHYPENEFLRSYELVSYTGMPFKDSAGNIIGHLAVLDSKPVPNESRYMALFRIFGNRAAAEIRRIRAEEELRAREERLRLLVDGALDGIIDFDHQLRIHLANPSARQLFAIGDAAEHPVSMRDCFTDKSIQLVKEVIQGLQSKPDNRQAWIGSRLRGVRADGRVFDIEATLSQVTHGESAFYTMILRDVHALHAAEQQILDLQKHADRLRDELAALQERGRIVGNSPVFKAARDKVSQVATTDATRSAAGRNR